MMPPKPRLSLSPERRTPASFHKPRLHFDAVEWTVPAENHYQEEATALADPAGNELFLTIEALVARPGLSVKTLHDQAASGTLPLPALKFGSRYLIPRKP